MGFSKQIVASTTDGTGTELLKKLCRAIKHARTAFDFVYLPPLSCPTCEVKLFTDNIVIGFPIPEGKTMSEVMKATVTKIAAYQCTLLEYGFFVRGGIAIGEHYMDRDIVFGPALIEAHDLESGATYPRIVFSAKAAEFVDPEDPLIKFAADIQLHYINYLEMEKWFPHGPLPRLEKHGEYVKENLNVHRDNPKVRLKYEWVKNYHNDFCNINFPAEADLEI
jgi:class 3 adenylate cyclase